MKTLKQDLYQEVTDKIVACLEQGVPPWVCPWNNTSYTHLPLNFATQNNYQGINIVLLWLSQLLGAYPRSSWLTFKQAALLGGKVRKHEQGTRLVFYKPMEKKTGEYDSEGNEVVKRFPLIRAFTVFNVGQIEGLPLAAEPAQTNAASQPETIADAFASSVLQAAGVAIVHDGARAYYRPMTDTITLPDKHRFKTQYDYYATATHELIHATGHAKRCDRKPYACGQAKVSYAYEELVAEMGASFCMAWLGISGEVVDHASYIDGWLQVLKADKKAIFKAAAEAQKAHEWLISKVNAGQQGLAA
ncbi:MAG: zincin-like metallopeptidase domain-containing protein [Candidatus Paceibacterota bacterium]|jgi:antirestriction protein ArdC